jgi:hypothetical protein
MLKSRLAALLLCCIFSLFPLPLHARSKFQGYAEQGGTSVLTALTGSTVKAQRSFPGATITVYLSGTLTPAILYSDSAGTAKPNPFSAASDAFYSFFTDAATVDISFSGGGIPVPFTRTGLKPSGGGSGTAVSITDFGAKCDGTTDDGIAIQAAVAAIQAAGGGTLEFPPAKDCRVYTIGQAYTNLAVFTSLQGVTIRGNGSRLVIDPAHLFVASYGIEFAFISCANVEIRDLRALGTATASDVASGTVKGVEFIRLTHDNVNFTLDNLNVEGMLAAVISGEGGLPPVGNANRNIRIGNMEVKNCWYGFNGQYGPENLTIDNLRTDTIHRSLFCNGGCRSLRARIDSKDPQGSVDVILNAVNASGTQWPIEDFDIEYVRRRDTASSGTATRGVAFLMPPAALPGTIRNGRIRFDVKNSGTPGSTVFQFSKQDNNQYGSLVENIEVSGRIEGTPSTIGGFPIIGSDPNVTWGAGDTYRNIRFRDLSLVSTNYAKIYTNSLTGSLVIDSVIASHFILGEASGGDAIPPQTGSYEIRNSSFPELYGTVGGFQSRGLEYISLGFGSPAAVTVPAAWSSHILTNAGNGGGVSTGNLPPAVPGLKYRLLRTDPNALRLDPNGAEVIRGGGAGKYLSLDATGTSVMIECFTAGTWELVYVNGTTSFEP